MRKAFTLIELVVAISILSLGIVMVLRSFLSANTALSFSRSKIAATQFLGSKLAEIEEISRSGVQLKNESSQGEVVLDGRVNARWEAETALVEEEEFKNKIYCLKVKVAWLESGRGVDVSAVSYFKAGK